MDRRPRLPTTLIPAKITGLQDLHLLTSGRILEVSSRRLHIGTSEAIPIGSSLRVEFEDSAVSGEVLSCKNQGSWHEIAVYVEEVLTGSSDLARLLASLIEPEGK